jgi:hypothetical protein
MIKLSEKSLKMLKYCLLKYNDSLVPVIEDANVNTYTPEFYNQLRQIVCDELIAEGFDENYEPNDYGTSLERLIDEIGRLFL